MRAAQQCTYRTNKFILAAWLCSGLVRLILALEDIVDGAIYEGEYREEDMGGISMTW